MKKLFKLGSLLTMVMLLALGTMVSSCGDDDEGGGSSKNINKVVFDGKELIISKVTCNKTYLYSRNDYDIIMSFSNGSGLGIKLSGDKHGGKVMDLSQAEPTPEWWYWVFDYNYNIIYGDGDNDDPNLLDAGSTMKVTCLNKTTGEFEIQFSVKKDGHVLNGYYKGETEYEYDNIPCRLQFDNATHNNAVLASAMNYHSPGIFVRVKMTSVKPRYYEFSNNQGLTEKSIFNAIDDRIDPILGMKNGLIVGFGNLDNPAVFYAYDAQCPNCSDAQATIMPDRSLSMTSDGHATCDYCHRSYNMNNRGMIDKGDNGKSLIRYHAATSGPYGILTVN